MVISSEENHPQVGLNKFLFHVSQNVLVHLEGLIPIIMTVVICHFYICPPKPSSLPSNLPLPADLLAPDLSEGVEAVLHCMPPSLPPVSDKGSLFPVYCWSLLLCSSSKGSPPGACSKLFLLCISYPVLYELVRSRVPCKCSGLSYLLQTLSLNLCLSPLLTPSFPFFSLPFPDKILQRILYICHLYF